MTSEEPQEEFSIHWIQDLVDKVVERNPEQYLIVTGKSMSGSVHIGFMKEIVIADIIKRELQALGKQAKTVFISDDYDPIRSFPPSLTLSPDEYMGVPYSDAPDPYGCCESLGAHWTNEIVEAFPEFGADPEVVLQSRLYKTKEMLDAVRTCLKHTETIREILIEYVARDFDEKQKSDYIASMKTWYPASVICPICGRIQSGGKGSIVPNRVTAYNQENDEVSYECAHCGHSETAKFDKLRLKLSWRVDWPAKWYVMQTTCEPAGKDHAVKGGSYDTGLEMSRRVFGWSGPVKVPFEWVRLAGSDMGTSKGNVFTPRSWLNIAPPELFRYIVLKTDLERANNVQTDLIPDLVDIYESFERNYYGFDDVDSEKQDFAKILYPLTEVRPVSPEYIPKLSFKFAVVTSQLQEILSEDTILERCYDVLKKQHNLTDLSPEAKALIPARLSQALHWVKEFGSEQDIVEVPENVAADIISTFTDDDKRFLTKLVEILQTELLDDDGIQSTIFNTAKDVGIKPKQAFQLLYQIMISRKSGPRLGPFLNILGNEWVLERIRSVL
ncbi:lysine--tRNA ligase [Candidatus Thorarchaeota archaeon]|nr:lysine--tRNA ligase [Candidatus Thorarchaeota archaeon]TFH00082.1 MAG: lysine--tRNA ligase [Candidatus Thorarchaeota archaeon]